MAKKPWFSKTVWANLIMAGLAFIPSISDKISIEQIMLGMAGVNVLLRIITKEKISLS